MRADGFGPGRPAKGLTLRRIRDICFWKVFELGKGYLDQGRVADLAVRRDSTLTGTILGTDVYYPGYLVEGTALEYMVERPQEGPRHGVAPDRQEAMLLPLFAGGICSHEILTRNGCGLCGDRK